MEKGKHITQTYELKRVMKKIKERGDLIREEIDSPHRKGLTSHTEIERVMREKK